MLKVCEFDEACFLCAIALKSLHTNIPVDKAIDSLKEFVWEFEKFNKIPNANFVFEILGAIFRKILASSRRLVLPVLASFSKTHQ